MTLKVPTMILATHSVVLSAIVMLFQPSISDGATSCECAVFTLDGVQDYFLTNVQMDIIKMFDQKNANLTIGIIGNEFGIDKNMTTFIQNEIPIGHKKSIIEAANNGWKDEDFTTLSKEQQSDRINKTQARLNYLLKTQPLTFIAPYGNMNNDTIEALRTSNLQYANAYWESSDLPVPLNDSNLYIIPPSMNTGILNPKTGLYDMISYDELVRGIKQNITDMGAAIVSMQPMEFAQRNQTDYINESNETEIKKLSSLLDDLRKMNAPTVTIRLFSETIK